MLASRLASIMTVGTQTAEDIRLEEDRLRKKYWKRWGPYLGERQWVCILSDLLKALIDQHSAFPYITQGKTCRRRELSC